MRKFGLCLKNLVKAKERNSKKKKVKKDIKLFTIEKGKKLTKNRAKQSKSENFYQPKSFENNRFGFYPIYVL